MELYKKPTRRQLVLGLLGMLALLAVAGGWLVERAYRPEALKDKIAALLSDQLESEVTLESLEGHFFPRVSLSGGGLVVRHKGRTDVPPLLTIKRFEIRASVLALMQRPRHVAEVRLQGLEVFIPPSDDDDDDTEDRDDAQANEDLREVIIDRFEAPDTVLTLIPRKANKPPKVFTIHHLVMDSVGRGQVIPYLAVLTNPKPKGNIEASGTFGPWHITHPARTPVSGKYTFADAQLDTIHGLAGVLSSKGSFGGPLNRIQVEGTTETPDFQVDAGGLPVPLSTSFTAIVDGSNGDTILERVDAKFLSSELRAKGAVYGFEGMPGRQIEVDVRMEKGRVEDLLKLAVDSPTPILTGAAQLEAKLVIPPRQAKVLDKMNLRGAFGLTQTTFTDPTVQGKIVGLSHRAQGKKPGEGPGDVMSNMKGSFILDQTVITFSELAFGVPGAVVELTGRYGIRTQEIDFHGRLVMDATLSQAAGGGLKSFLLKVVDPFFRKDGAGAVVPIKITGNRKSPQFGLELFRKDAKK